MADAPRSQASPPRLWYGWVVLAVVFLSMCTLIAVRSSFGIFFKAIAGEFGWSRAQTAGAFSAGLLGQALGSPLAGWLMDRWSIRKTMSLGVLATGAAVFSLAFTGALWQLYLAYFLLCLAFSGGTWVAQVPTLSNWFVARRGFAMGVANSAQGFAFALNVATPWLIAALGWRGSYAAMAAMLLLVTLPAVAILHRDHPSQMGTLPDAPFAGAAPPSQRAASGPAAARPGFLSPTFFLVAGVYASIAYGFAASIVHLVPHATDQGFSPGAGGVILAVWGAAMVVGNFASALSDRVGRTPAYLLGAASSLILAGFARGDPPLLFHAGAALSGLALGLMRPTASSLVADNFAGPGFGRINGIFMAIFALAGALGPWATGALFDVLGGYREGFWFIGAAYLAGAAFAAGLGRVGKKTRAAGQQ